MPGERAWVHPEAIAEARAAREVIGTLGVGIRGERAFSEAETEGVLAIGRELAVPLAAVQDR